MKTGIIFLLLVLFAIPADAVTYRWVDNQGNTNFTDDPGNVPAKYRKSAKIVGAEDEDVTPPEQAETKGATKAGSKAKGSDEEGGQPAVASKELKKSYGGKSAETWRRDFGQLNADMRAAEDQLAELKDRLKDTSKMSRNDYLTIQMGVNSVEARLQRLRGKLDALTDEANKAGVPADLRQ